MQILQAVHWKVHLFLNGLDGLMSWISSCPTSAHPPKDRALIAGLIEGSKIMHMLLVCFLLFQRCATPKKNNGFFGFVCKNDPLVFLCAFFGMLSDHLKFKSLSKLQGSGIKGSLSSQTYDDLPVRSKGPLVGACCIKGMNYYTPEKINMSPKKGPFQ